MDKVSVFIFLLKVEFVPITKDPINKGPGFLIRRNTVTVSAHGILAGIVSRQG